MKRTICLFLCLVLLSVLVGCTQEEELQKPVNFYYRCGQITYEGANGVIAPEQRESQGHETDIEYLLTEYLSGPQSQDLAATFPEGLSLLSFQPVGDTVRIVFSSQLASLSGLELTIACACITLTVLELTDALSVQIHAASSLLGDQPYITMDKNCLLLLDTGTSAK